MSSGLAESGPPETNTSPSYLEVVTAAPENISQTTAEVIPFPGPEVTTAPEALVSDALTASLEKIYFEDTDMIAPELAILGVHIEDMTDGSDGLAVMMAHDLGDQLHLSQHLIVGYDPDEDQISNVKLNEKFYRAHPSIGIEEFELIGEKTSDWQPGAEPDLAIVQAAERLSARIEQAEKNRSDRLREQARTYGNLITEKALKSIQQTA